MIFKASASTLPVNFLQGKTGKPVLEGSTKEPFPDEYIFETSK